MKQNIVIPRMGESITEATIGTIFKPSGSQVKVDDEILELETEKVNQVLFAPVDGVVHLSVKTQDVVKIGDQVGYIEAGEAPVQEAPKPSKAPAQEEAPKPSKTAAPDSAPQAPSRRGATEFAAELKKEQPELKKEQLPAAKSSQLRKQPVQGESTRTERRQKLPKIRKVIAERLVQAQHEAAMLTTFNEADLTQIILLRERYKEVFLKEYQVKLGYMPFFVKAAVSALKAFPEVNAYLDGDDLVFRNYFDIGIAVSTERGLVVPVVRNCDHLTFSEIEETIDQFSARARSGTLSLGDLEGGGFTITNGGVFGSLLSTPILNPPQTAILGMHKIVKRPVAINDQVIIRPMMYLALTYDHRVIDGREAVSFLVHIKNCLEDPARLLLEI
jgi:2-oxoglutarate dehydrogenase E2 component (dihydrolipoamide succinyltransferase)